MSPTLVVVNARVWTGEVDRPWAEAIAVSGDRLTAIGTSREIDALAARAGARPGDASPASPRIVDAGGRLLVPGFIDAHVHLLEGGARLSSVQLRDAATTADFVARIRAFAATVPEGTWITGGDWDHSLWGGDPPHRDWIDEVTPRHPVWVNRLDGHMALANTAALRAAGVTDTVEDVAGGAIDRDRGGRITGLLRDNAMALVDRALPPPTPEMQARALEAAMRYVAARGVTSIHHMGTWSDLEAFDRARLAGSLITRIYAAVPLDTWERLQARVLRRDARGGRGDEWLRTGVLKGFVDGSLGSHTAAFLDPFTDAPGDRGLFVNDPSRLYEWIAGADRAGLHVAVHAIGDRANRTLLDIYDRVSRENGVRDRRFRIEHAQHLAPPEIPRFAAQGVIASMQPYHAIDDGRWADRVIGAERSKGTYAFRSLIDAKAHLAFGSDWFVAPPSPLEGIYAAVTRQTIDGANPDGWVPAQKIAVEEALRAYTIGGAYASFEESVKGTLAPGKLADFVILERNLFEIPAVEIRGVTVAMTVVGGRIVYERR
jgi:predicted amidohydrolase YtcJ